MRIQYLNARPLINCLVNLFANVTFSSHVARGQESRIYMNLPINPSIKHGWDNAGDILKWRFLRRKIGPNYYRRVNLMNIPENLHLSR